MIELPPALQDAIAELAAEMGITALERATSALIAEYHGDAPAATLASDVAAGAYAAYRMPATYAAMAHALTAASAVAPVGSVATRLLDLGGGTGAAAWAAYSAFPSLRQVTVLDRADAMRRVGRRLAAAAPAPLRDARWEPADLATLGELPPADLITLGYALGELTDAGCERLAQAVADLMHDGAVVAAVEPGTPAGYARIVAWRDRLLAAGGTVLAPCPHDLACPIPRGRDWCHVAQRVARSPVHRRVKGADLPYEDEKLAYVVVAPADRSADRPTERPSGRIVARPAVRKGVVTLPLCTADGALAPVTVSKRQGAAYRAARKARWGDAWR